MQSYIFYFYFRLLYFKKMKRAVRNLLIAFMICVSLPTKAQQYDTLKFVNLAEAIPDVILEIRYYSTYNFVGARIDGYEAPVAIITRRAADSLRAVSDELIKQGYRLKIYDAYRPQRAVDHFARWAADANDTLMRAYFYPMVDKSLLFELGYIARKSSHSRGSTVDLTIVDMRTGKDVDMGSVFDWFGNESHFYNRSITAKQLHHRLILRKAMMRHGFQPISTEWWHYTLKNEPFPNTYFDFLVK